MKALLFLMATLASASLTKTGEDLPVVKERHTKHDDRVLRADEHNVMLERHHRTQHGESHSIHRFYSSDPQQVAKQREWLQGKLEKSNTFK